MDLGLKGRVAAVSAASKGLGRACAEELAREGADLSICARGEDALRATQKELEELGGRVLATPLDMVEPRTCERFIDEHLVGGRPVEFLILDEDDFERSQRGPKEAPPSCL